MIDRLTLYPFDPFAIDNNFTSITISDAHLFLTFVHGLQDKSLDPPESGVILSYDGIPVTARKSCLYIGDLSECPPLTDIFLKPAITEIAAHLDEENLVSLMRTYQQTRQACDSIFLSTDIPLQATANFDPAAILALMKPVVLEPDNASAYDKIQAILDIAGALGLAQTLVLLRINEYCSQSQVNYVISEAQRLHIQVLDLEHGDHPIDLPDGENHYVDKDFVQFS